ncbi:ABC transporter substrate-binding protein [Paenibacillus hodogayensis]|uniref:ABC transporter substrate-binding protein n=1 Tax=Paenibacillus hodogayensis TaxID=279208 RepID=A0ABV5VY99_9BACL
MNKHKSVVLSSGISMMLMLSACGGTSGKGGDNGTTVSPERGKEPVELTIVTNAGHSEDAFNARFGDSIRKKFPNYTIKYIPNQAVKFADLVPTNTQVDIVYAAINDFMNGPVKSGMAYDMRELIKKHGVDTGRVGMDWVAGLSQMWDNKIYGLPISLEALTLFYNKDIFDKFGVLYPKDGMTWDNVLDLNQKLTRVDQGVQYAGITISPAQHFSLSSLSVPYYDSKTGKSTLGSEEAKWKLLYETIAVKPLQAPGYKDKVTALKGTLPAEVNFLKDRSVAMAANLAHLPLNAMEMKEMNWDMVSYPTYKEAPGLGSQANLLLFGVTNMSKHKDEAMEVIQYLYSDEFQTITSRDGNIPAVISDERIKQYAQNTYFKDRNVKAVFHLKFAPLSTRTLYDPDLSPIYRKYINNLATGEMDLNSMMRKVEEEAEKAITAIKNR